MAEGQQIAAGAAPPPSAQKSYDDLIIDNQRLIANFQELKIATEEGRARFQSEIARLRKDNDTLREQLVLAQHNILERNAEMESLKNALRDAMAGEEQFQRMYEGEQADALRLRREVQTLEEVKSQHVELQREYKEWKDEVSCTSREMQRIAEAHDSDWKQRLQRELEEKDTLLRRLEDRSQDDTLKALRLQNREMEARMQDMSVALTELRGKVAAKVRSETDAVGQMKASGQRTRELERELEREKERLKQSQASYEDEKREAERLHSNALALETKAVAAREEAERERDRSEQTRLQHLAEIAAVERERHVAVEELERERSSLRDQLCAARADLEQSRLRHEAVEQRLKQEASEGLLEESDRRRALETRVAELTAERIRLVERYERERAALRDDLTAARQETDSHKQRRQQVEEDREQLQVRLTQLSQEDRWRRDEMERFQLERAKDIERQGRLEDAEEQRVQAEEQLQLIQVHLRSTQQQLASLRQEAQKELTSQRERQERALVVREQQLDEERQGYSFALQALQQQLKAARTRHRRNKEKWMGSLAEQIKRTEELAIRCERMEDENNDLRRFRAVIDGAAQAIEETHTERRTQPADPDAMGSSSFNAAAMLAQNAAAVAELQRALARKTLRSPQRPDGRGDTDDTAPPTSSVK
eukprot:Hpha_TRINITY_DN13423_c0_g1::TRINITY_DN13423_c0_g1_i1::g.131055::m.131055